MGDQSRWKTLLSWLKDRHGMQVDSKHLLVECRDAPGAGKGLFANCPIPPKATLFTIPASALINARTLSKIYPQSQGRNLSPVQMVSLHLLLHKPSGSEASDDPTFGPFIDTMPRTFDSHPLVWSVVHELGIQDYNHCQNLLYSLPPSTSSSLQDVKNGFWKDWSAVRNYVIPCSTRNKISACSAAHLERFHQEDLSLKMDYIWAWLSVNTRCIYYRLDPSPSSPLNMTLCPILDFANHAPQDTHILPVLPPVSQPSVSIAGPQDIELYLRYGAHPNRRLFVEYGFVNIWDEASIHEGRANGEVDVSDIIEAYFKAEGSMGVQMKTTLKEEGYWGDWTLHSTPQPAHPSYRLITALRLLHCTQQEMQKEVQTWKDVLRGEKDVISETNEALWRETLLAICRQLSSRAAANLETLGNRNYNSVTDLPEWYEWAVGNVRQLWFEELCVANCVADSITAGVDF